MPSQLTHRKCSTPYYPFRSLPSILYPSTGKSITLLEVDQCRNPAERRKVMGSVGLCTDMRQGSPSSEHTETHVMSSKR